MFKPFEKLKKDINLVPEISKQEFDVRAYLNKYGIEVMGEKRHGTSVLYTLKHCIFDPSHNNNESAIGQTAEGKLFYQCFHNSCRNKTWHDARQVISGDAPLFEYKKNPSYNYKDNTVPMRRVSDAHISKLLEKLKREIIAIHDKKIGIDPGFSFLRNTIHSIMPTHLWVIGGYTSSGKTQFMVDLLMRIYTQTNPKVLLFSTEMSATQYLMRFIAWKTEISSLVQQHETLNDIQYVAVEDARDWLKGKNLYLYDDVYKFEKIKEIARMHKKENGVNIIVLDYIQNLIGQGSIYERMSSLSPQIQALAKELDVCFVALSQVSNEAVRGDSQVIGFKGAGEIAAAADIAIWLTRSNTDVSMFEAKVRKNRHGKTGIRKLQVNHNWTRIIEKSPNDNI